MARPSKLSVEQWEQIRQAYIAGVPSKRIADEFGITHGSIREAARKAGWPTPTKIKRMVDSAKEQAKENGLMTVSDKGSKTALILTSETLSEAAAAYSLAIFDATSKANVRAVTNLPDPTNWKTAAIVDQMARRAAGLDRPESTSVSVNLAMFASMPAKSWRKVDETG